jgi:alcohol oxidase
LVIEGGQNTYQVPSIIHAGLFFEFLSPESKRSTLYQSVKEPAVADRTLTVPVGGTLGGGSSVNIMMYTRAQRHDFDSWNTPGWSADDLVPYMKKVYNEDNA